MNELETYKAAFDSEQDGIIICNHHGKILLVNRRVETLFGYSEKELIAQPIEILIPRRFHHHHVDVRDHYLKQPSLKEMETRKELNACRKDGSEFFVEISLSPIQLKDRMIVTTVVRDITQKKEAERKIEVQNKLLLDQNQELERFAYIASHDLQEPLRTVSNYVTLFNKKYEGQLDKNADLYLEYISSATLQMQLLIRDLLTYSKIGFDKSRNDVDCNLIVKAIIADLNKAIAESGAEFMIAPLPVVIGNMVELKSLFQNLISNAIKYRNKIGNPLISIAAVEHKNEYLFSITDNGIGIESKFYERIFIIFQKLHGQKEYDGTGIGLAQSKKIVEHHGGKIWVESEVGKGSTFYFTIAKELNKQIKEINTN